MRGSICARSGESDGLLARLHAAEELPISVIVAPTPDKEATKVSHELLLLRAPSESASGKCRVLRRLGRTQTFLAASFGPQSRLKLRTKTTHTAP